MKTVSGNLVSRKPIGLEQACCFLSEFSEKENGTSQAVAAYIRRTTSVFNELLRVHSQCNGKPIVYREEREEKREGRLQIGVGDLHGVLQGRNNDAWAGGFDCSKKDEGKGVIAVDDGKRSKRKRKREIESVCDNGKNEAKEVKSTDVVEKKEGKSGCYAANGTVATDARGRSEVAVKEEVEYSGDTKRSKTKKSENGIVVENGSLAGSRKKQGNVSNKHALDDSGLNEIGEKVNEKKKKLKREMREETH